MQTSSSSAESVDTRSRGSTSRPLDHTTSLALEPPPQRIMFYKNQTRQNSTPNHSNNNNMKRCRDYIVIPPPDNRLLMGDGNNRFMPPAGRHQNVNSNVISPSLEAATSSRGTVGKSRDAENFLRDVATSSRDTVGGSNVNNNDACDRAPPQRVTNNNSFQSDDDDDDVRTNNRQTTNKNSRHHLSNTNVTVQDDGNGNWNGNCQNLFASRERNRAAILTTTNGGFSKPFSNSATVATAACVFKKKGNRSSAPGSPLGSVDNCNSAGSGVVALASTPRWDDVGSGTTLPSTESRSVVELYAASRSRPYIPLAPVQTNSKTNISGSRNDKNRSAENRKRHESSPSATGLSGKEQRNGGGTLTTLGGSVDRACPPPSSQRTGVSQPLGAVSGSVGPCESRAWPAALGRLRHRIALTRSSTSVQNDVSVLDAVVANANSQDDVDTNEAKPQCETSHSQSSSSGLSAAARSGGTTPSAPGPLTAAVAVPHGEASLPVFVEGKGGQSPQDGNKFPRNCDRPGVVSNGSAEVEAENGGRDGSNSSTRSCSASTTPAKSLSSAWLTVLAKNGLGGAASIIRPWSSANREEPSQTVAGGQGSKYGGETNGGDERAGEGDGGKDVPLVSRLSDIPSAWRHLKAAIDRDFTAALSAHSDLLGGYPLRKAQSTGTPDTSVAPSNSTAGGEGDSAAASVTAGAGATGLGNGRTADAVTSDEPVEVTTSGNGGSASEKLGRIQFSIAYDFPEMTLTLRIIRAVDLAAKDFSGTSDPYVKIMLLPDKKRKLTTNVKRKNLNPRWNEVFAFEGFPYNKLMHRTLFMQVLDYDRFSRDDPIGEVCIPLSEFDLSSGQVLWKNLQPCKGHTGKLGELNVGLCYQPTAGKITVVVDQARELKSKDINGLSDPYVKLWLLYEGKKSEKKKTTVKEKTLSPIFNESFDFDVPYERIRATSISISVMDYDRMGRNEEIGQVILGTKSGPMEVKHWNEMFAKARQTVTQWHVLKDFS